MTQYKEINDDIISIIITVLNGDKWIDKCFQSIIQQNIVQRRVSREEQNDTTEQQQLQQLEICVFDDGSYDNTYHLLQQWKKRFQEDYRNISMKILRNDEKQSKGVGFGRNRAIDISNGNYLCFQDIDDEMLSERLKKQCHLAKQYKNAIIGSKFIRIPVYATQRFAKWSNELSSKKLKTQIYTSNGPTVIMPTWFCHRQVYDNVQGGFCEDGPGCPEDLIFFYKHLDNHGDVKRVEEVLIKYRYHLDATTFSIAAETIWSIRLQHLIENHLNHEPWLNGFIIWNAGKQGRRFFRHLPHTLKIKVKAFCDVDQKKVNKIYRYYDVVQRRTTFSIPIIHFSSVQPPLIICMKLDLTNGYFESNLESLNIIEGRDYILFT